MIRFYAFSLLLMCLSHIQLVTAQPLIKAQQTFQTGHYEQAISHWQTVLATTKNTNHRLEALFGIARAQRWIGDYDHTLQTLNTALSIAQKSNNLIYHALLLNEFSKLYLSQSDNKYEQALQISQQAMSLARKTNNPMILAEILKHRGNILTRDYDYEEALAVYGEALTYIDSSQKISPAPPFSQEDIESLSGKILISQAQTTFLLEKDEDTKPTFKATIIQLEQAIAATKNWSSTYDQAFALISLNQLIQKIQAQLPQLSAQLTHIAYQTLQQALKIADHLDNAIAKSYVHGYLGQLYEQAKRYDEAISLTQQALFFAQQNKSQPLLYLWQKQLGQIKSTLGNNEGAIRDYQQAIQYFDPIRFQAMTGYINLMSRFREQVAPVYFELADLLLQQANSAQITSSREQLLQSAIDVIETFKEAELRNYFQSSCIDLKAECADLKSILDSKTAILYPIILPTRLELLLYRREGLTRTTLPIGENKLHKKVISFLSRLRHHPAPNERDRSKNLQASTDKESNSEVCRPSLRGSIPQDITRPSRTILTQAKTLYNWLIKPLIPHLQGIEILVMVPDGALRTIPFAALHDGQQFLIQKYALAVTPSLCFNEPHIVQTRENMALLSGLSQSVQGFSSLPCTQYEIEAIQSFFPQSHTTLFNKTFTTANVQNNVNQTAYSIIHIASHGQFSANLEKTFILTHDNKLSMDRLERLISTATLQNKPVELLTLSACETAVGDDQAALGLAGVALKAGVKSAVASLWKVDDEATPAVVIEFYRQLQNHKMSKAKALQYAQNQILTHKEYAHYRHPYYWSAFLLIGSWF